MELTTFAALILGSIALIKFTTIVMEALQPYLGETKWLAFISYILTFAGVYFLVQAVGKLIEKSFELIQLGFINRLMGSLFGILKAAFMVSLVFWLASKLQIIPEDTAEQSISYQVLAGFAPAVITFLASLLPFFRDMMEEAESLFDQIAATQQQ